METLITTIRTALADDASAQTRQAGAAACRTILAALDAAPGTTLALNATAPARTTLPGEPPRLDVDQVLGLVIARLRAAVPSSTDAPATARPALTIPTVPIPK